MSSTSTPTSIAETIDMPFGNAPSVAITIGYKKPGDMPDINEMDVVFDMLDALLKDQPLSQWEH